MARTKGGKREALARDGVLNPHPEAVRDALFADNPFFDPADLVQVRYEMVRRHEVDGQAIGEVAAKFGVSRPTFYKAQRALAATGLTGLLPGKRGPKGGHKLSDEMLAFDVDLRTRSPGMTMAERLRIEHRFGIKVHRRSLERAVARKKNDAGRPVHRRHPAGRRLRGAAGGRLEWALEWPGRPRDPHSPRARGMDRRVEAAGASRNPIRGLSAHAFGRCGISPAERAHPCSRRNHRRSDDGGRSCTQLS